MQPSAKILFNQTKKIVLAKTPYASLEKLNPPVPNQALRIQITNGNAPLANAIRRTLMSEIPVKHLSVALSEIKTNDPYIIGEAIKKRIEMIPISQSIKPDSVFALRFENNTDSYVDVMSSEIKLNGVSTSKDIIPNIPLCDINSNTTLAINDIRVTESFGYDNSRVSIGRIAYEIMDVDFTQSALATNPTTFEIEIETPGVIDPIEMVHKAIDNVCSRLDSIDFGKATIEFDVYSITISNETYTIGKLISWYIYKIEPTIQYVASRIPHPSKRECIIDVHHPSGEELCKKAILAIKSDFQSIKKTIK